MANYRFYEVLSDMGHRPQMYALSSLAELRTFAQGYEFALRRHGLPAEIPPFHQFTEWLVRRLGRGSRSLGWWELIQMESEIQAESTALQRFGKLIDEFALRVPSTVAEVYPNPQRHTPTGHFRLGYKTHDNKFVDLSQSLPKQLRIVLYATDEGCYLEYHFHETHHESYHLSMKQAQAEALADYQVSESDWLLA